MNILLKKKKFFRLFLVNTMSAYQLSIDEKVNSLTDSKVEPSEVVHCCDTCSFTRILRKIPNNRGPVKKHQSMMWRHKGEQKVESKENVGKRIRAGVFLYCPPENKLLIVQVYNQYYGLPKGGVEKDESLVVGALRELKEEAGIELTLDNIDENKKIVLNQATYFIVEVDTCLDTSIQVFDGNDVTGVGWVHIDCICKLQHDCVTSHLIKAVKKILGKDVVN